MKPFDPSSFKDLHGEQLFWSVFVILAIILFFLARYLIVSGKDRFEAEQKTLIAEGLKKERDKEQAMHILQSQITDLKGEILGLKNEVHLMAENEQYNREYRHSLANQNMILKGNFEVAIELLRDMTKNWDKIPDHFKERVGRLKTPSELLEGFPLPERRFSDRP